MTLSKKYREQPEYKKMTSYKACELAEGFGAGEEASDEERLVAWQWLHDRRIAYKLQGFYGRTATHLIEKKLIAK